MKEVACDAATQHEVFEHVAEFLNLDEATVIQALEAREAECSTEVGGGVALPHASVDGLDEAVLVDVKLGRALRWGKQVVKRCFCVVTPKKRHGDHTLLLAEAARRATDAA